jgi:hypothetical protein
MLSKRTDLEHRKVERNAMLHARIVLAALIATASACASKKAADTAPSAEPASEPAQPAVDLAIFDENQKDFDEMNAVLPEFEKVAKAAAEGPTAFQNAVTAVSDLAKEKGVKEKRVDKIVSGSLKAKKVKLRGVKKADREGSTQSAASRPLPRPSRTPGRRSPSSRPAPTRSLRGSASAPRRWPPGPRVRPRRPRRPSSTT